MNSTLYDTIQHIKNTANLTTHPYFQALQNRTITHEGFVQTQMQFLHAVAFFPRPLMALAARIPNAAMRLPLIENAFEEHGEGDLSKSHEHTFMALLKHLGVSKDTMARTESGPEVTAFNAMFWATCRDGHVLTAIAMVGMFEDLFSGMSTAMGKAIVNNGWLDETRIEHYNTHETLDQEHARELYDLLLPFYPAQSAQIERGLRLGVSSLLALFEALHANQNTWHTSTDVLNATTFGGDVQGTQPMW